MTLTQYSRFGLVFLVIFGLTLTAYGDTQATQEPPPETQSPWMKLPKTMPKARVQVFNRALKSINQTVNACLPEPLIDAMDRWYVVSHHTKTKHRRSTRFFNTQSVFSVFPHDGLQVRFLDYDQYLADSVFKSKTTIVFQARLFKNVSQGIFCHYTSDAIVLPAAQFPGAIQYEITQLNLSVSPSHDTPELKRFCADHKLMATRFVLLLDKNKQLKRYWLDSDDSRITQEDTFDIVSEKDSWAIDVKHTKPPK